MSGFYTLLNEPGMLSYLNSLCRMYVHCMRVMLSNRICHDSLALVSWTSIFAPFAYTIGCEMEIFAVVTETICTRKHEQVRGVACVRACESKKCVLKLFHDFCENLHQRKFPAVQYPRLSALFCVFVDKLGKKLLYSCIVGN